MAKFGKCCCCPCATRLPSISIGGYTPSGDWVADASGCCWKRTYTANSSAYSVSCVETLFSGTFAETFSDKTYATVLPKAPLYFGVPPCPADIDKCCHPTPPYAELCSGAGEAEHSVVTYMQMQTRYTEITLYYRRTQFTCSENSGCKYMLGLVLSGDYKAGIASREQKSVSYVRTSTTGCLDCDLVVEQTSDSQDGENDCSKWPAAIFQTGLLSFARVLLFDDEPAEGTYTFNSSALSDCDALEACFGFQPPTTNDEYCVTAPSYVCTHWKTPVPQNIQNSVTWGGNACYWGATMFGYSDCGDPDLFCTIAINNLCTANLNRCSAQTYLFDSYTWDMSDEVAEGECYPDPQGFGAGDVIESGDPGADAYDFFDCGGTFAASGYTTCNGECCNHFACYPSAGCSSCTSKYAFPVVTENAIAGTVTNSVSNPLATYCITSPNTSIVLLWPS